jgi:uncharacterized protein YjbJ (UPF0337 family)
VIRHVVRYAMRHVRATSAPHPRHIIVRPDEKGVVMDNKDQVKGKVKQAVGDLTNNKDLKKRGKADEKAGEAKEVLENVKDKAEGLIDKVKDKVTKH